MFNKQTPHVFDCTNRVTASSELLNLENQAQITALCTALQHFPLEQLDMENSEYEIQNCWKLESHLQAIQQHFDDSYSDGIDFTFYPKNY